MDIYSGLTRYQLVEIRQTLWDAHAKLIAGRTVESVTINGQSSSIKVLGIEQVKREISAVNKAISELPEDEKQEGDPAAHTQVRRYRKDYSFTNVC